MESGRYSRIDTPEVARDLEKMDAECVAFETDYKGKLPKRLTARRRWPWLGGGGPAL